MANLVKEFSEQKNSLFLSRIAGSFKEVLNTISPWTGKKQNKHAKENNLLPDLINFNCVCHVSQLKKELKLTIPILYPKKCNLPISTHAHRDTHVFSLFNYYVT